MDNCKKYYTHSGYVCDRCGFIWDYDDKEPPLCLTDIEHSGKIHIAAIERIKNIIADIPVS